MQQLLRRETIELNSGFHTGCCTLPSGKIVVTDFTNSQLKLFNTDGTIEQFRVDKYPFDVKAVNENLVAVSYSSGSTISIVDVSIRRIIRSLPTENEVRGISYIDDHIMLCVPRSGIKKLNIISDTIDNVINDDTVSGDSCVVASSDRICYSCPFLPNTVTVLDSYYNVLFKYQNESLLMYPWGVTIDMHNNIYVTCYWSDNVLVIPPDVTQVRQLLGRQDEVISPTAVHYCHHTERLVVVSATNDIKIFSLE